MDDTNFDENTDGSLVTKKDTKCDCCAKTTECYVATSYGYDEDGNERSREQYACHSCAFGVNLMKEITAQEWESEGRDDLAYYVRNYY